MIGTTFRQKKLEIFRIQDQCRAKQNHVGKYHGLYFMNSHLHLFRFQYIPI